MSIKIPLKPTKKLLNYYLVDTNFFLNRFLPYSRMKFDASQQQPNKQNIEYSHKWWKIIDQQLKAQTAYVFIPNVCISEAFKSLAKMKYQNGNFKYPNQYTNIRKQIGDELHINPKETELQRNKKRFHDLETGRDVIIGVDRFLNVVMTKKLYFVSTFDLMLLAQGKLLMRYFNLNRYNLFLITADRDL